MKRLVCLHGFTGTRESWDGVLARLPPGIEAICPSIVGHDPDVPLTGASFEDEVDRLAGALPAAGGPFHLAGYSMGGRLALGLLVRYRRLFCSATLIGAHPGLGRESERRERRLADEELARRLEQGGVERFVDHWQGLPLFASQCQLPQVVLEAQRQRRLSHAVAGLAYALRTLGLGRMPSYRSQLSRLEIPVDLMAGEHDGKFRRLAESMASALPRGTVEVAAGAGHNLIMETPRRVAAAVVRRVLAGGRGGGSQAEAAARSSRGRG